MDYSRVADLTVEELRSLIKEVVTQTLLEMFADPDKGLELREDIQDRLHNALVTPTGSKTTSAQEVAAKLGLEW